MLIDGMIAAAADLTESEDPLDAELVGATVMSIGAGAGESFEEALIGGFIPEFEARANSEALALLLAIGSVADDRAGKEASAAAARLVEAGVPRPGWAAELGEPVTVADCLRLSDAQGTASMLACSFHRAGRSRAVVISVDHQDCGAASAILLLDVDQLPEALQMMRAIGRDDGLEITTEALDAAEFRWQVEKALDARAVHDSALSAEEIDGIAIDEDGPVYPALAVLMRARMNALPMPNKPAAPHGDEDAGRVRLAAMQTLAQLTGGAGSPFGARTPPAARGRTAVPALPAKRKKSDRPAPVYQIKVGLRGAKPPIWRRLEVPADISLARLHTVIQIAFGWDDSHLHVFETPYGSFGTADADLGHRAETSVTLEQVAPAANSTLRYTYDFGADWDHDILVEKVLDQDETAGYPRCTGGRRAAPPDDCGGIWGYAELVEVLRDPADKEHEDRLEWLGLDAAAEFDPDRFDAEAVTRALSFAR
ncbi:MAG TPA: plasmid pRiA4b ORF-3 family protein [Nakamurella sp.]